MTDLRNGVLEKYFEPEIRLLKTCIIDLINETFIIIRKINEKFYNSNEKGINLFYYKSQKTPLIDNPSLTSIILS